MKMIKNFVEFINEGISSVESITKYILDFKNKLDLALANKNEDQIRKLSEDITQYLEANLQQCNKTDIRNIAYGVSGKQFPFGSSIRKGEMIKIYIDHIKSPIQWYFIAK